ncbi:MAG: hypothetical protein R2911_14745 [Caldilineaceae bacterium]
MGLNFGHYWFNFQGDDYVWPYASVYNHPDSWAASALGSQPLITALDPFTATVNSAAFSGWPWKAAALSAARRWFEWHVLPTTFVDGEHLTAQVSAGHWATAGQAQVKSRRAISNPTRRLFAVEALAPDHHQPVARQHRRGQSGCHAHCQRRQLCASDAQVLWNGEPLATQFVNATQVKVQLSVLCGWPMAKPPVAVRNQSPAMSAFDAAVFEVTPQGIEPSSKETYLPIIAK